MLPGFGGKDFRMAPVGWQELLEKAAAKCRGANVFGTVSVGQGVLSCAAKASAAEAFFRLSWDGKPWVSLVTKDRWLSQSIEADLVHTGDKLEELLAEELADLDYTGPAPAFEHFRSEDKLFTFRSVVPVRVGDPGAADVCATFMLAYEACFRRLGDMEAGEEE
jgi:hypothetical protein